MSFLACVPSLERFIHIMERLVKDDQHILLPVKVVKDVPLEVLLAVLSTQTATMAIEHSNVEQVRSQLYHSISKMKIELLAGCTTKDKSPNKNT